MFSERVNAIKESGSVTLATKVNILKAQGLPIVSLSIGEPDFLPHQSILEATKQAIDAGEVRYGAVPGVMKLRELIAQKMNRDHGMNVAAENVLLSNGSKQILYNIFQLICNPGDEVIVPVPYWVTFPEAIKLAGATPVFINPADLRPTAELIEGAITKNTKAVILNSPNNPSSLNIAREELEKIAAVILKHNLVLISDEAYEAFYYGERPTAPASLSAELFKRTLTVQSFSKTYGMTGFRQGYMVADTPWIQAMIKLQGHVTGNNCTFSQFGAIKALELPDQVVEDYRAEFQRRGDLAFELGRRLFDHCPKPEGAFYLFPEVSAQMKRLGIETDTELALAILEKAHVALLPGSFFGTPNRLRLSFAASTEDIKEAFARLEVFFK
jgi:aspartate aminotransferase